MDNINEMDYMSHAADFNEAMLTHLTTSGTDANTEEELRLLLYEHYALRLYTEKGITHCINNAIYIFNYLCIIREPEKQIVIIFGDFREWIKTRFLRIHKGTSHTDNLPVAFILDGIFSALWYILNSLEYRSKRLTIAMNMIQRHLYPYINSLPENEKGIIADWDTMRYEPGEPTLLETLANIDKKIPVKPDPYLYYPPIEQLKEATGNYDMEQVRIYASLTTPFKESQEEFLNEVVTGVRNYYIDINTKKRKAFTPPFRESARLIDENGSEELQSKGRININMDDHDNEIKRIAKQLGIPPAWGMTINYSDDTEDHSVKLYKKLEPVWYGISKPEEITRLLPDTDYHTPEWINMPDNPKATNYELYREICEKTNKIQKWERGLKSGDVNIAIAMMLNIRQNTQEKGRLTPLFEKRNNTNNPFSVTLLNLMGHVAEMGYLNMTDREITTTMFGESIKDGPQKNVKKGRIADVPDNVKDVLEDIDTYLNDIRRYREHRSKITFD